MTERLADGSPRAPSRATPSPKHVFDREPLLIPRLFADSRPWYRDKVLVAKVVAGGIVVLGSSLLIHRYGFVGLLGKFATRVSRL